MPTATEMLLPCDHCSNLKICILVNLETKKYSIYCKSCENGFDGTGDLMETIARWNREYSESEDQ